MSESESVLEFDFVCLLSFFKTGNGQTKLPKKQTKQKLNCCLREGAEQQAVVALLDDGLEHRGWHRMEVERGEELGAVGDIKKKNFAGKRLFFCFFLVQMFSTAFF